MFSAERATAAELAIRESRGNPDYLERNRAAWELWAPGYVVSGRKAWAEDKLGWGIWDLPESDLGLFAGVEVGSDVIELGCGPASTCAWLARRGVRIVAIDFSLKQTATARDLQRRYDVHFPVVVENAEDVRYEDASFDFAFSEYGVSLWSDPRRWLPEARRLLRPGGQLFFITNGAMLMACTPDDGSPAADRLVRDYFSGRRVEFSKDGAVEFHPTHGEWVHELRNSGFLLESLIETRPPANAEPRLGFASTEWARRWPSEEIWVARAV
jgi:SAM-dependent methyltransferase